MAGNQPYRPPARPPRNGPVPVDRLLDRPARPHRAAAASATSPVDAFVPPLPVGTAADRGVDPVDRPAGEAEEGRGEGHDPPGPDPTATRRGCLLRLLGR